MKWLWLILTDPLSAFDLRDNAGQPDHGKVAGFLAFWVFVGLILVEKLPPLGHTIVMFSAIFGARVFIAFLKSRTVTASEARLIQERRDLATGTEPTGD